MMLVFLTIMAFNFESGILRLEKKDSFYITRLLDSVYIYDDTLQIRGMYGTYNEEENLLFVGGKVSFKTPGITVLSDSLLLRSNGNIILFMGNCEIVKDQKDTLWGNVIRVMKDTFYGTYNIKGHFVSRNLYFFSDTLISYDSVYILKGDTVRIKKETRDTLKLWSRYIIISKDTVYSNVRTFIRTGKYTVFGDTFFYYDADSEGMFSGDVVINWDSGTARADTGIFYLKGEKLDSIILKGRCNLMRRGKDNDIKLDASLFRIFFVNDSLHELVAEESNGVLRSKNNE